VLLVVVDIPDPKTGQLSLLPNYFFLVAGFAATVKTLASEQHFPRIIHP